MTNRSRYRLAIVEDLQIVARECLVRYKRAAVNRCEINQGQIAVSVQRIGRAILRAKVSCKTAQQQTGQQATPAL